MATVTPADLDALDKLREAATAGPWELDPVALDASNDSGDLLFGYRNPVLVGNHPEGVAQCAADGELIVAAVNALPELIAAARERDTLRRAVLDLADEFDKRAMYGGALVWTRLRKLVEGMVA